MRFFLTLAYKGTAYNGWQIQPNVPSVQETLQKALSAMLREEIEVVGAGRTDTGVHASFYIAHFDTASEAPLDEKSFCHRLNLMLPKDIAISGVRRVKDDAHARYDARLRKYTYGISQEKDPFSIETTYHYTVPLDIEKMNQAAALLKEYEDFASFCKLHGNNKTTICHIKESYWTADGPNLTYTISADRFLRNMVRAIVGTLIDVGRGKITPEQFREVIESKSRGAAGKSAPPQGLFLADVHYPDQLYI